ncbi:MAG: carbon-nitrogen hydrolase family protein [Nitrospinota bacterium]
MGDNFPRFKAAAIQAAPVFLDREASVEKACRLIAEAASEGARLIAFPEVFIPGYPYWNRMEPAFKTRPYFIELVKNSVEVPSPATERLCDAAREAGAYVVIGINERPANTLGTLFNTNLVMGPRGRILLRHRKLMPTFVEKLTWGLGDGAGLRVLDTEVGKLGTLICGENANPLARFALLGQGEQVHVANYPALPAGEGAGYDLAREVEIRGAAHAFEGKVFNIVASGTISQEIRKRLGDTPEKRKLLEGPSIAFTAIFAPGGKLLAGPLDPNEEGILYAECDIEQVIAPKLRHDVAGHYNRFDILSLDLNRAPQRPVHEYEEALASPPEGVAGTALPASAAASLDGLLRGEGREKALRALLQELLQRLGAS